MSSSSYVNNIIIYYSCSNAKVHLLKLFQLLTLGHHFTISHDNILQCILDNKETAFYGIDSLSDEVVLVLQLTNLNLLQT